MRRIGLLGGAVAASMLLMATNAYAGSVHQGDDYASSNGTWVEVCDMEQDGNGVYGQFYANGSSQPAVVWDGNGSQGGCGNATYNSVSSFRVCEDTPGPDTCSSWARP